MRVVIIEDENYNYKMLNGMVNNLRPDWEVVKHLVSVKKSVEWFTDNPAPDLVFMDIQLADGICFSIFDEIQLQCPIVFTTAYDNYAIQAFEVNSVDYLLKPIKESKLELTLQKFEQIHRRTTLPQADNYTEIFNAIKNGQKKYRKRFLIQGAKNYYQLRSEEIAYFYNTNKITTAVTFANTEQIVDFSMESLEEQMDPAIFFRANRQYIVNIDAISKLEDCFNGKLTLTTKPSSPETITISRLKASTFKGWLDR